jgi:hypothetical protein
MVVQRDIWQGASNHAIMSSASNIYFMYVALMQVEKLMDGT